MLTFATLGPMGTNHELVTREYIQFHGINEANIVLLPDFKQATEGMLRGEYDFVIQCAVHPDTPQTMGASFSEVFAVDSFISRSKDLAVLTRKEVEHPESIGLLMPATESYIDISKWRRKCPGTSLPLIFEGLLRGDYDSALVYLEYADQYPDQMRVDEVIGSPDDVWIVYGLERTSHGAIQAWRDAPISGLIERKLASKRMLGRSSARS